MVHTIIVTYNGMQWIDRCMRSLMESLHPAPAIVVDNGSSDGTCEYLEQHFPDVVLARPGKNLGFGAANNIGLRMAMEAGADHAFLLNQDAWVQPDTIGRLVQASKDHPKFGVLSPMHLNGSGDALDRSFSNYLAPQRCPGIYSDLALGRAHLEPYALPMVNAAAWLITSACLNTVGGFNPSFFHYGEDDNYAHRVAFHGLKMGVLATAWIHHDRDQEGKNSYFEPGLLAARRLRIVSADPNKDLRPFQEMRNLRLSMVRDILSLQRTAYHVDKERYRLLRRSVDPGVLANRTRSMAVGPTFL